MLTVKSAERVYIIILLIASEKNEQPGGSRGVLPFFAVTAANSHPLPLLLLSASASSSRPSPRSRIHSLTEIPSHLSISHFFSTILTLHPILFPDIYIWTNALESYLFYCYRRNITASRIVSDESDLKTYWYPPPAVLYIFDLSFTACDMWPIHPESPLIHWFKPECDQKKSRTGGLETHSECWVRPTKDCPTWNPAEK